MPIRARTIRPAPADGPATVVRIEGALRVRDRAGLVVEPHVAFLPLWTPAVGDRVLLAEVEREPWIIAVLSSVNAGQGRTVVEAASGDLVLRAPSGRVRVEAGLDLELEASRDLLARARRDRSEEAGRAFRVSAGAKEPQLRLDATDTELGGERVVVRAKVAEIAAGALTLLAKTVATRALQVSQEASRWELSAGEVVEKARESLREIEGLAHERIGRATTVVRETFSLRTKRTDLVSEDDTAIDGRKVLLG